MFQEWVSHPSVHRAVHECISPSVHQPTGQNMHALTRPFRGDGGSRTALATCAPAAANLLMVTMERCTAPKGPMTAQPLSSALGTPSAPWLSIARHTLPSISRTVASSPSHSRSEISRPLSLRTAARAQIWAGRQPSAERAGASVMRHLRDGCLHSLSSLWSMCALRPAARRLTWCGTVRQPSCMPPPLPLGSRVCGGKQEERTVRSMMGMRTTKGSRYWVHNA